MPERYDVELRLLRYFIAVADAGSVTAAAREVHVSQPSLSRQLRGLERQLGLALFNRGEGRLGLTSAGRHFLPVARDVVARADLATRAAAAIRDGAMSTITISCPGTTLTDVIAPFLATWEPADPMPSVWERLPSQIYPSVETGADLAVGTQPPPDHLASLPLASLPVWAYVPPTHPWAARGSVPLAELVGERLLVLGTEQHSRQALDSAPPGRRDRPRRDDGVRDARGGPGRGGGRAGRGHRLRRPAVRARPAEHRDGAPVRRDQAVRRLDGGPPRGGGHRGPRPAAQRLLRGALLNRAGGDLSPFPGVRRGGRLTPRQRPVKEPAMHASVGDRLIVHGTHVDDPVRDGEIIEVRGKNGEPPYVVRWSDDGHEGFVFPGPDATVQHFEGEDEATS